MISICGECYVVEMDKECGNCPIIVDFVRPWGRVLLAIVYMQPETQIIRDCDDCQIEDCNDCNFEYIEREAERKSALKRIKLEWLIMKSKEGRCDER